MSTVKVLNCQIGQSLTATNNFCWYQPSSPDGTVRLGNGNAGATTLDTITVNSSGNVGIGTSSPATKLDVSGTSGFVGTFRSSTDAAIGIRFFRNGVDVGEIGSGDALFSGGSGSTFGVTTASATPLLFGTNSVERMRLDSSGNLGLGVTPSGWASGSGIQFQDGVSFTRYGYTRNAYFDGSNWRYISSAAANLYLQSAGAHSWFTAPSGTAGNAISFTQAMTLDASGNLLVGTTSAVLSGQITNTFSAASKNGMAFSETSGTTGATFIYFTINGTAIGNISRVTTTNAVAYNTSSDQRLKENIVAAPSAIDSINSIKVRSFDWKADGSHVDYGYIAQELLEVAPEAVSVPADPEEMMGVDFGKLTPRIIKALQELSAELNELKAKVNA